VPAGARRWPEEEDEPRRSPLRTTLGIVAAIVVVLVVGLVAATQFFGGDDEPQSTGNTIAQPAESGGGSGGGGGTSTAAVRPADVTVAVLNGTTVPGLARGVANRIQTKGFKIGNVTNASDQSRSATIVEYDQGSRSQALAVARLIGVGADAVEPMGAGTRVIAGQDAPVVVTVGADQTPQSGQ
jgi:hypothetical protein